MVKDPTITIPLSAFVSSHLGHGFTLNPDRSLSEGRTWYAKPVNKAIADTIFAITNNEHTCYIEYPDSNSPHLTLPILWDYNAWRSHCDSWMRERQLSEKRRIERFIFEANTKILAKQWNIRADVGMERALQTASTLIALNRQNAIKEILRESGISLITKESELK